MTNISNFIVPAFVLFIIIYGVKKKVNIYDSFLVGAKEGLVTTFRIAPTVIGMVFAINLFLSSHFLEYIFSFFINSAVFFIPSSSAIGFNLP